MVEGAVNWQEFARRHPVVAADMEPDPDGRHGAIAADPGGAVFISTGGGDGPSMILAALDDCLPADETPAETRARRRRVRATEPGPRHPGG
jgi:hypothetical protein